MAICCLAPSLPPRHFQPYALSQLSLSHFFFHELHCRKVCRHLPCCSLYSLSTLFPVGTVYFSLHHVRQFSSPSSRCRRMERYPLQVRHKQDWGRGFILLLPQAAALPGSNAGSDIIKPASGFVIQNRQTSCSMWCPMYRARC